MKHDKPNSKYKYCHLCKHAIPEKQEIMWNVGSVIVYYCNLCLCEDCGNPLDKTPDMESSSRFCNTKCQARFKGW